MPRGRTDRREQVKNDTCLALPPHPAGVYHYLTFVIARISYAAMPAGGWFTRLPTTFPPQLVVTLAVLPGHRFCGCPALPGNLDLA